MGFKLRVDELHCEIVEEITQPWKSKHLKVTGDQKTLKLSIKKENDL